ncbi:hypothetical protein A3A66_03890 [Microgenomates group bacterium RIFCSPLOWO2_01_FULL_46_13]|nr:MAG: hypothetical protein A3A66_03890 [Microgenomates group bacterium RIFCSPLOWO2_01_FULL_46_13]
MAGIGGIGEYYLAVQALTPAEKTSVPVMTEPAVKSSGLPFGMWSLIVFVTVLFLGMVTLMATKTRNLKRLLMVLTAALITAVVPLGLDLTLKPTSVTIRAGAELVPKNLVVDEVTQTGFTVRWETGVPVIGTVRLGTDGQTFPRTHVEAGGAKTTVHKLTLTQLRPGETYYFEVLSHTTWYNDGGQPLRVETLP